MIRFDLYLIGFSFLFFFLLLNLLLFILSISLHNLQYNIQYNNNLFFKNLGSPRLLFDFGSGIQEITINIENGHLNDGNWHQLDIQFDSNLVHLMFDACIHHFHVERSSSLNNDDDLYHYHHQQQQQHYKSSSSRYYMDIDRIILMEKCQNYSIITKFQHVLNVNSPLQLGGIELLTTKSMNVSKMMLKNQEQKSKFTSTDFNDDDDDDPEKSILPPFIMSAIFNQPLPSMESSSSILHSSSYHHHYYHHKPPAPPSPSSSTIRKRIVGFNGCMKNVIFNNHIYDLINVHHSYNTQIGCHSCKFNFLFC